MKKGFLVYVERTYEVEFFVEAETVEEANRKMNLSLNNGEEMGQDEINNVLLPDRTIESRPVCPKCGHALKDTCASRQTDDGAFLGCRGTKQMRPFCEGHPGGGHWVPCPGCTDCASLFRSTSL